jgi:hypothetical protein
MKFLKPRMRRPSAVAPHWAISPVAHGGRTADLTGPAFPLAVIPTGLGYWPLTPRVAFLATTKTPRANARNTAFCTYLPIGSAPAGTGARRPVLRTAASRMSNAAPPYSGAKNNKPTSSQTASPVNDR